jgi:hypothetical protein
MRPRAELQVPTLQLLDVQNPSYSITLCARASVSGNREPARPSLAPATYAPEFPQHKRHRREGLRPIWAGILQIKDEGLLASSLLHPPEVARFRRSNVLSN